ncbi:MAG TPA: metallophosphoesterase [Gemmatimonadales bacterium]|nr:metallophosphoesterase [Gemmatimonadales bacterium]
MPGVLPGEDEDGREPVTEADVSPSELPPPVPGGDLGAAVAAALQAALERTGVVPPSLPPPAQPATPEATEPLDLLDTSSAPWLTDPELGVQWAESWIASQTQAEPARETEPVGEAPPPASPDAAPAPIVQDLAAQEPVSAAPEPTPERPEPPSASAAPPETGSALPPRARPFEPRSLELFAGHGASMHREPVTWARQPVAVPEPVPVAAPIEVASPARPASRLHWITGVTIGLVIGLLAGLVAYAVGPAVTDVYLTRYDVPVERLPTSLVGLRIVQVSDLHLPGSAAAADSAARLVVRARPDIVLITGDMIDDASPATLAALDRFLTMTRGTRGTFAVLGEGETALRARLERVYEAKGVRLLTNERASVDIGNARLVVEGFDGSQQRRLQLTPAGTWAMPEALRPRVHILMTHAPQLLADVPRADLKSVAFVVAGHTLGGPLGLPSPFGASTRYRSGWYTLDATHLYVSNGVGTGRLPARLLAPAEVTRFTLRRAAEPYEMPTPELPGE